MSDSPFFRICKSLIILLSIAGIGGLGLLPLIGFWYGFSLLISLQFIAHFAWKQFVLKKKESEIAEATANAVKSLESQNIGVVCPCTRNETLICPIRLDSPNEIQCEFCNKHVGLSVDINTFLKTETINIEQSLLSIDQQFDQALKQNDGKHGTTYSNNSREHIPFTS